MRPADIQGAVLALVSRHTGISVSRLSLDDRLLQDLGVDGDDAAELLIALSRDFGIDLSSLVMEKHFRSEPNLLSILRRPRAKRQEFAEKIPVRIRDLIHAVEIERWPL